MDEMLLKNVARGFLPAGDYASICDFMASYGKPAFDTFYYNAWHWAPATIPIEQINRRRASIGLNTFEVQENNVLINRGRRKKHGAYSGIITE